MTREGWRFPPERRDVLRSQERRDLVPVQRILDAASLSPGNTAVDLGAGTGFWTEPLSARVGEGGTVYAVDVEPVMLEELRALNLPNVQVVQSEELTVPLPAAVADLVLLGFVLHEPPDPTAFLDEVVRLLKPAGQVMVIDWPDHPTDAGPPLEVRIPEEEARALLGQAGLAVERLDVGTDQIYALLAWEVEPGRPEMTAPTA